MASRKHQSAKKTPRYPNYQKRAASENKAERLINQAILKVSDEQLRQVHGDENQRKQFISDVEFHFQRTRPTKLFIDQNPNIIEIMGKEAAEDRKYHFNLTLSQFSLIFKSSNLFLRKNNATNTRNSSL